MGTAAINLVLAQAVCDGLRRQVEKLGLSIGDEPRWADAADKLSQIVDPYTGEVSVMATWSGGERYGTATFSPDGRVFAEYQVLLPHPKLPNSYVEAVQVWGDAEKLRGDAVIAQYAA
jgi:hypothetical protein